MYLRSQNQDKLTIAIVKWSCKVFLSFCSRPPVKFNAFKLKSYDKMRWEQIFKSLSFSMKCLFEALSSYSWIFCLDDYKYLTDEYLPGLFCTRVCITSPELLFYASYCPNFFFCIDKISCGDVENKGEKKQPILLLLCFAI